MGEGLGNRKAEKGVGFVAGVSDSLSPEHLELRGPGGTLGLLPADDPARRREGRP